MTLHDMVGLGGVAVYLLAYWLLQIRVLSLDTYHYSLLNLIGSGMMLYSLCNAWNLSAAISSSSWALISGMGIIKIHLAQKKAKTEDTTPEHPLQASLPTSETTAVPEITGGSSPQAEVLS